MSKLKVVKPAIVEKSGKVDKAKSVKDSHDDIIAKTGKKGQHEFVLSDGTIANRKKAAKIAKAAGEVKKPGKKLHSHELRESLGIKKASK